MTRLIIILILIFIILTLIKSFLKKSKVNFTGKDIDQKSGPNSKNIQDPESGHGKKDDNISDAKFEEFK